MEGTLNKAEIKGALIRSHVYTEGERAAPSQAHSPPQTCGEPRAEPRSAPTPPLGRPPPAHARGEAGPAPRGAPQRGAAAAPEKGEAAPRDCRIPRSPRRPPSAGTGRRRKGLRSRARPRLFTRCPGDDGATRPASQ